MLSQSIDVKFYRRLLTRRRWLILSVFAGVAGSVALFTLRQPKVYAATVSVIIDPKEPRFLDNQIQDVNNDLSGNYWVNKEYLETQFKIITSRAVAERVLKVHPIPKVPGELDAVAVLQRRLKVEPVRDSRVSLIKVEDGDADRAAVLANAVAQAYIDELLFQKVRLTENATRWLDERRDSLASATRTADLELYNFRRQSDMLSTSIDDRANMVSARLASTSAALTDAQVAIAGLRARVAAIRALQTQKAGGDRLWAEALPEARENAALTKVKERLLAVKHECDDLASRYLEQHPKLKECRERLVEAEGGYARELGNLVLSAEAALREALEREHNLTALFASARAEAFQVEKKKLELDRLKTESENTKRQYDSVFKRLKDIELSGLLRTSNVRVLDPAQANSRPVRPNVPRNIFFGALVGLFLGFGAAVLLDMLDSSISSQVEIEERLGLTYLGFVPTIPDAKGDPRSRDLYIFREPKSSIAECTRAIRTNLLFMSPSRPARRLLVTSSGPQEGKSTTVINLAVAMAQTGNRVLVVDTDMCRPRLHRAFGLPNDSGVSSIIVGDSEVARSIRATEVPGVSLLPCGPVPPNPAELLHTQAFRDLLATLDTKFDRVILDSPPLAAVADAVVLATLVDGVVFVLQAGTTQREVARRTVRALRDVSANIYGAVLNNLSDEQSRYGDYGYGYTYRYYGERKDAPG